MNTANTTAKYPADYRGMFESSCHCENFCMIRRIQLPQVVSYKIIYKYEGWNFNSGNYLFTTDTK